jgi:hypothetical protein
LEEDPDTLQHELMVLRSESGAIETMPGSPYGRWRVRMPGMSVAERSRWKLIFDRTLAPGGTVELIRDTGRYFWLTGETARDICAGQDPSSGQYSLVTQAGISGQDRAGGIGINPANPGTATRTNLIPNGDFVDTLGWTNDTPTTLSAARSTYARPGGALSAELEFNYLAAGTKRAHIDFDLAGYNATTLPGDVLTLSCLIRADVQPNTILSSLVDIDLIVPSSAAVLDWTDFTPTADWTRLIVTIDTSTIVPTDTTLRLRFTLTDDLKLAPVYVTEVQVEARAYATSFIPYSTSRSLTGSRAAADGIVYINALQYRHQLPTWRDSGRWAFTVAFVFVPGWSSANIPTATVTLYNDGDTSDVDTVPALRIHATSSTIVATAMGAAGTAVTATKTGHSWSAGTPVHILATVQEKSSGFVNGTVDLYVDGVLAQSSANAQFAKTQGKFFWIGSRPDGSQTAAGYFSDFAIDPVFMDGTTVPITDYRSTTHASNRPDRNSCRAVLDPAQRGRSDRVTNNEVPLDVQFIEVVT